MKTLAAILVLCLAISAAAQADRILIDVGSPLSGTIGNWNNFAIKPVYGGGGPADDGGDKYLAEKIAGAMIDGVTGAILPGVSFGVSNLDDVRPDGGVDLPISNAGLTYPDSATNDIAQCMDNDPFFGDSGGAAVESKVIISGLSSDSYDVSLLCARYNGSRAGWFSINGSPAQLIDAVAHNSSVVTFTDIVPQDTTIGGVSLPRSIVVAFWGNLAQGGDTCGYADLNVVDLIGNSHAPEPMTAGLLVAGALMVLKRRR